MTDITIDETTGLPELPEGQYWKVVRNSGSYMWDWSPVVSPGYYVQVQQDYMTMSWSDWVDADGAPSWALPEGFEYRVRKTSRRRWYGARKKVAEYRYEHEEVNEGVVHSRRIEHDGRTYPDQLDIQCAAIELMEDIAAAEGIKRLLGAYPPKSLADR